MDYVDAVHALFTSELGKKARRLSWETSKDNVPKFVYLVAKSEFVANKEPLISMFGDGARFFYAAHVDAYYGISDGLHCLSVYMPSAEDRNATDWVIE